MKPSKGEFHEFHNHWPGLQPDGCRGQAQIEVYKGALENTTIRFAASIHALNLAKNKDVYNSVIFLDNPTLVAN